MAAPCPRAGCRAEGSESPLRQPCRQGGPHRGRHDPLRETVQQRLDRRTGGHTPLGPHRDEPRFERRRIGRQRAQQRVRETVERDPRAVGSAGRRRADRQPARRIGARSIARPRGRAGRPTTTARSPRRPATRRRRHRRRRRRPTWCARRAGGRRSRWRGRRQAGPPPNARARRQSGPPAGARRPGPCRRARPVRRGRSAPSPPRRSAPRRARR